MLLTREGAGICDQTMTIVQRDASGVWTESDVPVPASPSCDTCAGLPDSDGETCEFDYYEYDPLGAIVSATGEVAALYMHTHTSGTMVASCGGPCMWMSGERFLQGDLYIATPLGRPQLILETTALFTEGQIEVEPLGRIHIAAYEIEPSTGNLLGRYLRLDPLE